MAAFLKVDLLDAHYEQMKIQQVIILMLHSGPLKAFFFIIRAILWHGILNTRLKTFASIIKLYFQYLDLAAITTHRYIFEKALLFCATRKHPSLPEPPQ